METNSGKISRDFFKHFVQRKCGKEREEVRVKPGFGVDVSVIDLPNRQAMAVASDPLSLIPSLGLKESAWISVQLTANDIATTGFAPQYGQFVLNLPNGFSQEDFQEYWKYIHRYCKEIGIAITGGHTGFVEGQNSTVCGGATFWTIAPKSKLLTTQSAKPGDSILVTKTCALSAAAILAKNFPQTVQNKVGKEHYESAAHSFYDISVLKEALIAKKVSAQITAMHDVTEGGVLGAIYEMATASGNGVIVNYDNLPVGKTQTAICELFSLNPRYCVGAGALIITCKKEAANTIQKALNKEHIDCTEVGRITCQSQGMKLIRREGEEELSYVSKDPYWEAFYKAIKAGWL